MGQREIVLGTCWELGKHARKPLGTKTWWEHIGNNWNPTNSRPPPPQIVLWGNEPKNHPKNLLKAKNCQTCGMDESGQCGWSAFDYGQRNMDNQTISSSIEWEWIAHLPTCSNPNYVLNSLALLDAFTC